MDHTLHKIIRLAELSQYVGLKRTQIEHLISQGKFPAPVRLSARRKGWIQAELITWQQEKIAQRAVAAPKKDQVV